MNPNCLDLTVTPQGFNHAGEPPRIRRNIYRQDFNIEPLPYWRRNDASDRQGVTENFYVQGYLAYLDSLAAFPPAPNSRTMIALPSSLGFRATTCTSAAQVTSTFQTKRAPSG